VPENQGQPAPSSPSTGASSGGARTGVVQVAIAGVTGLSMPVLVTAGAFLLLVVALIIFFVTRKRGTTFARAPAANRASKDGKEDAPQSSERNGELAQYAAAQSKKRTNPYAFKSGNGKTQAISPTEPLLLNLFVEDQSTNIGKRNIQLLKSGSSLSVGGGNSDFLIFLVPVPANIGEIRRSGSLCTFVPKKPKYFPDLGSSELRDCINKTIRIVSDRSYELHIRFEMYEDPLDALNRVLMSIKMQG
jgi:hypothetical protein